MKILHVTSVANPDGNGVAVAVKNYFDYEKTSADVAVYNLESNFLKSKFSYNTTKYQNISSLPNGFNKPDLVVFNEVYKKEYIRLYKECEKKGIAYIIIPHGCLTREAQKKSWLKKKIANPLFFNGFLSGALAIQYLNSEEIEKSIIKDKKYIIAGNGISPRSKKNLCKNKEFIYIGRYSIKHKGLDLLVKTASMHKKWFIDNNIIIHLYGRDSGSDYSRLVKMIRRNNVSDIILLDDAVYGDKKNNILLNAYAFIQPSRWEGQPMGVLEALSYGLPCIVTFGTSLGGYVNNNKCGIGINFDSEELFNAIKKMSENEGFRNRCAERTMIVEKDYSWESVTRRCITKYKELLCSLT